jgi:hypothetical protein
MRRFGLVVIAAFVAMIVGGVVVTNGGAQEPGAGEQPPAAQPPPPPPSERTFRLIEDEGTFRFIDNPPRSRDRRNPRISAGDILLLTNRVLNEANTPVGRLLVDCTAVRGGRTFERAYYQCEGTYRLGNGVLTILAGFRGSEVETLTYPVVGGTGAYEGARGSIRSRPLAGDRTESTFHLLAG